MVNSANEAVKCHYKETRERISMRGSCALFGLWLSLGHNPMSMSGIQDNQKRKQDTLFKQHIGRLTGECLDCK